MKNFSILLVAFFGLLSCQNNAQPKLQSVNQQKQNAMNAENIYQFTVTDLYGDTFNMSDLKGKKVIIVNTASKCGLTPQYKGLEQVYQKYKDENLVVVGFPANNFASQEPGTNAEIGEFCEKNYGVTFPMMGKISVKGDDMHELYQFLTKKERNGLQDSEVQWNFQKYLIDENGHLVKVIDSRTEPTDKSIISWIES